METYAGLFGSIFWFVLRFGIPVLITIAATTLALVPLAIEGGPLWQGLCYAQIGGLLVATTATLGLVPVLYAFVVLDLGWIKWTTNEETATT